MNRKGWGRASAPKGFAVTLRLLFVLAVAASLTACGTTAHHPARLAVLAQHGNHAALARLERGARSGDAKAQVALGDVFCYGRPGRHQYAKAVYWWRKAAKNGDSVSEYNLGLAYKTGHGVPKNYIKAVYWWKKAATHGGQGQRRAAFELGLAYAKGRGVPKNTAKVFYWWKKAAVHGDTFVENYVADAYSSGQGVPKNAARAVYWWKKAAAHGGLLAELCLADAYYKGQGVPQDSTKAIYWFRKAAVRGARNIRKGARLAIQSIEQGTNSLHGYQGILGRARNDRAVLARFNMLLALSKEMSPAQYEDYMVTSKALEVARNFHSAITAVTSAVAAAQAGQTTLIAMQVAPGRTVTTAPTGKADQPVLSYTADDPAASGTIGASATNFAFVGSLRTTGPATPTYCGEVDVASGQSDPVGDGTPGAWVAAGMSGPVYITIGTACNGNETLGNDIIKAVVGDGSTSATSQANSSGTVTVPACKTGVAFCEAIVGSGGSVTP